MEIAELHYIIAHSAWNFFEISAIEFVEKRFAVSWSGFADNILAAIDAVVDSIERFELIVECDLHYPLL